jgi:hypothetical protein
MTDPLDVDLEDEEQIDEIELLGELMVLASAAAEELDPGTIDATLGVAGPIPAQRVAG